MVGGGDLRRRRHDEHGHAFRQGAFDAVQQIGVDDDGLRAAILEEIARLVLGVVPVDGNRIGAERPGGERGGEEGEIVAQHQRDGIVPFDAQRREPRRRLRRLRLQGVERKRPRPADKLSRHVVS